MTDAAARHFRSVTVPGPWESPSSFAVSRTARSKAEGRLDAPRVWTATVVDQTKGLPRLLGPCELDVEFVLPADRFPGTSRTGWTWITF